MSRRPVEILTPAEIRKLLLAVGRGVSGVRNRAAIVVLWRAGLRVGELVALRPADLNLREGTIRVLRGKGARARTVVIDPEGCAWIERWLEVRAREYPAGGWLFPTRHGSQMKTSYFRQLLPRLARRAGIGKRVHCHALRHTHAVELVREGWPLPLVQAQLGHANLSTTATYIAHFHDPERIAAASSRPSWTAKGRGSDT